MFFVITRDNERYDRVKDVLRSYADWYGIDFGEN
jgi:hypothetical protein